LLSQLTQVEVEGSALAEEEIVRFGMLMVFAAGETTEKGLSPTLRNLIAHPERLARVRADRSLVPRRDSRIVPPDRPTHMVPAPHLRRGACVGWGLAGRSRGDVFSRRRQPRRAALRRPRPLRHRLAPRPIPNTPLAPKPPTSPSATGATSALAQCCRSSRSVCHRALARCHQRLAIRGRRGAARRRAVPARPGPSAGGADPCAMSRDATDSLRRHRCPAGGCLALHRRARPDHSLGRRSDRTPLRG